MSFFDKASKIGRVAMQAAPLVQSVSDLVGHRAQAPTDYDTAASMGDTDYSTPFQNQPLPFRRRLLTEQELRTKATSQGRLIASLTKTVSSGVKIGLTRLLLINNEADEEAIELYRSFEQLAEQEGVSVYQFQPSPDQLEALGIIDKQELINQGKKAIRRAQLIEGLDQNDPELDDNFQEALIQAYYWFYKEKDEAGELQHDGVMSIVLTYVGGQIANSLSKSEYNIIDIVLDIVFRNKRKPYKTVKNQYAAPQEYTTVEKLADYRNEEHRQNLPNDADSASVSPVQSAADRL